jgi:ribose transport system permease protein
MKKIKEIALRTMKSRLVSGTVTFMLVFILNISLDRNFFSFNTIYGNLSVITPIVVATIAQSVVILTGNIDLSIGASISLVNCILAVTLGESAAMVIFGLLVSFLAMMGVSTLNGVLTAFFKLPSMVATFATSTMLNGITLLILPVPGGHIPRWLRSFYAHRIKDAVPVTVFILLAVGILWTLITKTRMGKYIYAVGGNETAAAASGINVKKIKLYSFLISGMFVWLTGLIVSGQTGAGDFRLGNPYTMTTVAAAIMGGISLSGGSGKMLGAALGGSIMILIANIIFFAGISSYYQDMIRGLIVIIALTIAAIPKFRQRVV